ncbi:MAG: hypothetical protein GEU73_10415 [Chloroflexi bacterium]|nr:hypothetical protein [Chloroflexota bacterium]
MRTLSRFVRPLVAFAILGLLAVGAVAPATAGHSPADKVVASASNVEILGPIQLVPGTSSATKTLLSTSMRTSNTSDLILQVTLECSLVTDVKTVGNDDSTAMASLVVWVEIDGVAVPVSEEPKADDGKATFCQRLFRIKTSEFDDQNATIEAFLRTKATHGFNWIALNPGHGIHSIDVKGVLTAMVAGKGQAQAIVGKRTLVVEPVHMANDARR